MRRVIKHSIKTAALSAAVFFVSMPSVAETATAIEKDFGDKLIIRSVNQHPDVVEKFNAIEEKAIAIGQILADDSLKINLSNNSKIPWKRGRLARSKSSDCDDDAVCKDRIKLSQKQTRDLVLTIDKTLIDFGLVDNNIAAEEFSKLAIKLDYLNTFELTLKKLINGAISMTRAKQSIKQIEKSIVHANTSIDSIKKRFELGVGTISQVRQAQLLLLELDGSLANLIRESENSRQILMQEFKIDGDQARIIANRAINFHQSIKGSQYDIEKIDGLYVIKYQRSSEMINHQKNAIRSQIKSVDSGLYPKLGITLKAVGYDWDDKIEDYDLHSELNLSMPLYDGGSSSNKKRGLEYKIKMLLDREVALDSSKNTELNDLIDRTTEFNIERKLAQQRFTNLTEKLERIKQRKAASEEVLSEELQTELSIAKEKIKITEYDYYSAEMNINFLSLSEILAQRWWKH